MLDECDATATLKRQEKHAEAAFEKMMNEKSSDWFSQDQNSLFDFCFILTLSDGIHE